MTAFEKLNDLISRRGDLPGSNITISADLARELRDEHAALLTERHAGEFELFERPDEGRHAPRVFARIVKADAECAIIDEAVAARRSVL